MKAWFAVLAAMLARGRGDFAPPRPCRLTS